MKILLVEDHRTFGEQMTELLSHVDNVSEVHLRRSMSAALEAIGNSFYDLLILDLSIPVNDEDLEVAREHGQSVFYEALRICPGIPIFILTGSEMDDFTKSLARHGEKVDLWGSTKPTNTLDYFEKENADRMFEEVARVAAEVRKVEEITLNFRGKELGFSAGARRVVQVAARRMGAASAEIVPLSGGLSRARVVRATMHNAGGQVVHATAAKLGSKTEIDEEIGAFHRDAKRLPVGFFPPLTDTVDKGACGSAGIFYSLAEGYRASLFDLLAKNDAEAAEVVDVLRDKLKIWTDASAMKKVRIADVRRRILWDQPFEEVQARFGLDLNDVEAKPVAVRECCIHGDLHGGNVLVDGNNRPILIDFGDVGTGPACLDPIMLELSSVFHPDGVRLGLSEKLVHRLSLWPNRDDYEKDHPFPKFALACREWAYDAGGNDLSVLAASYAYVVRQLRFDTIKPELTLELLASILKKIRAL